MRSFKWLDIGITPTPPFDDEVDYGFCLLDNWDTTADKPMLIFVHEINGSPRDCMRTVKKLDASDLNVALYHYPSGLGIDDNALVLAQVMNEIQI